MNIAFGEKEYGVKTILNSKFLIAEGDNSKLLILNS